MIQLVDSLAHPTLTGDWLGRGIDSTFASLNKSLHDNGYLSAFAIGMDGVEGYDHEKYIEECKKYTNLYPVAGFNPYCDDIKKEIKLISDLGYVGIKIHPRFSSLDYYDNNIQDIVALAGVYDLTVFYCTYAHCGGGNYPQRDPFYFIADIVNSCPKTNIILVHGGDVNLLKYAELVRHNKNTLLDLSLTFMKYKGSSIDLDIKYLFKNFDRRICIGSDHPEYTHADVVTRFQEFVPGVSKSKLDNISHKNILKFVKKVLY